MIGDLFNSVLYQPLYNGLAFLISVMPFGDVGFAIILLTVVVKFVILPLTHKSIKAQARLREVEPEIKKIKEKHKDNKQEQSREVINLYKKHGINPFSGCIMLIIQMPIIIALYWVFWKGLTNGFDESNLYSFVAVPEVINMKFLGFIDLAGKSLLIAAVAGITQFFQMRLSVPQLGEDKQKTNGKTVSGKTTKKGNTTLSFKEEFGKSFRFQMKYGFPVIVFFISYTISAAVALYWTTSNTFSIIHELIVKRKANKLKQETGIKNEEKQDTKIVKNSNTPNS